MGRSTLARRLVDTLDYPKLFYAARFLLVGRQEPTKRRLRAELASSHGEKILDLCCGIGEFAGIFDAHYVGVDLNPRFVAEARRAHRALSAKTFTVGDALALPFPDRTFDKAVAVNCLHHFSDDAALAVLRELRRVTRDFVLVVDIDGTRRGLVRRTLLALDRGDFVRTPAELRALVARVFDVEATSSWDVGLYTEVALRCPLRSDAPVTGAPRIGA